METRNRTAREPDGTAGATAPRDLNGFGICVYRLMLSRGFKTVARLAERMGARGYSISRQAISNYTTGRRNVPATFVVRLAETLDLSEDERRELAWAFAYGQDETAG